MNRDALYADRRTFLRAVSSLFPLGFIKPDAHSPVQKPLPFIAEKIGLHMGSVQQQLAEDPMQTLGVLDQLSIRILELQDTALLDRLHPVLKGAGFQIPSSFFPSPYITGNWNPMAAMGMKIPSQRDFQHVVDQAARYSLSYLVMPGVFPQDRGGLDDYRRLAEKLNQTGEQCREAGVQLAYYHHSYELQPMENTNPLEVMAEIWDESLVKLQPNTLGLGLARQDILAFLKRYAPFLGPVHLADIAEDAPQTYRAITLPPGTHQPLGKGAVDFSEILTSEIADSIPYFFIHLEAMDDPLESLKESVSYLDNLAG
jgi:sugar phosphate isomerase/epimerase